jgi:hypothetical protein
MGTAALRTVHQQIDRLDLQSRPFERCVFTGEFVCKAKRLRIDTGEHTDAKMDSFDMAATMLPCLFLDLLDHAERDGELVHLILVLHGFDLQVTNDIRPQ